MFDLSPNLLAEIADRLLLFLSAIPASQRSRILVRDKAMYHGFKKARIEDKTLREFLGAWGLTSREVQIEIVTVTSDLSNQVHYHEKSTAYVAGLGLENSFGQSHESEIYLDGKWSPFASGHTAIIHAGEPHGFRTTSRGLLHFLSIQSPPIVDHDGHDDYHLVVPGSGMENQLGEGADGYFRPVMFGSQIRGGSL